MGCEVDEYLMNSLKRRRATGKESEWGNDGRGGGTESEWARRHGALGRYLMDCVSGKEIMALAILAAAASIRFISSLSHSSRRIDDF